MDTNAHTPPQCHREFLSPYIIIISIIIISTECHSRPSVHLSVIIIVNFEY